MAESYDIQLTDPLSAAFKVRAFTSNGPKFPTSTDPNLTATSIATSLLIFGKGHPEYGERINENILHILENFSGSTEPKFPVSGQLWFRRYTVIRDSASNFYLWDDTTSTWGQFIPTVISLPITDSGITDGDYWFDGTDLYLAVKTPSHPLSPIWLLRIFEDRTVVAPSPSFIPRKELMIYDGVSWKPNNSVLVSEISPPSPQIGDLWYDDALPQLKIYNGISFVSVADRYLELGGGIMTGSIDMGTNLINNLGTPIIGTDAANKAYVDSFIGGVPSALDDLTDVTVTVPALNEYLKYNGAGQWINVALSLTDFGITASTLELNYSTGLTSSIQAQLNNLQANKLNLSGGTMTGAISLPSNPTLALHAATKQYVDTAAGSPVLSIDNLTDVDTTTVVPIVNQLLQFDGLNWVPSDYIHTHMTTEISHTTGLSYIRDMLPTTYPVEPLDEIIESVTSNMSQRFYRLDDFARREVFVATAAQTDFGFTDGNYFVGSNRLNVYMDGVKQYVDERARQRINFDASKNVSPTSLLGFVGPGTYDLDITIDSTLYTISFALDNLSTISNIISDINAQLTITVGNAVWNYKEKCIYVFSVTTGNGSSVDIVDGIVNGIIAALDAVPFGAELPVLTLAFDPAIVPPFPTNVTNITASLDYKETLTTGTGGNQEVDVGGAKISTDPTGLANDATVYTASIVIDGVGNPISIVGSSAQDYVTLLAEINLDITGAFAALVNGNILVTSSSIGITSTIAITDTNLFGTLTGFIGINAAVPGTTTNDTTHGNLSSTIIFNNAMIGGEIVEMTSTSTSNLLG